MAGIPSPKIFIGGMPYTINEDGLKTHFEKFGTVVDSFIVREREEPEGGGEKKSKGFGFITYEDQSAADEAIQAMNQQRLEGRKITVNYATKPSQIQGTEVTVVAINSKVVTVVAANSKVATVVLLVVVNNRVAMTEAMEVSNRVVVLLLQVMTHKLRDTVPSHLQLIPTTKAMVPKTGPHNLEAMVLLLLHLVMELGLVPIKDIKLKVRDMIKLKHLHLPILLEVALMDRLHHNNMEANLHMVVVRLVDRLRATMHSQLHNTRKDKAILRLHQVTEILVPGTDE